FIAGLGAAAWPVALPAQEPNAVRRGGFLTSAAGLEVISERIESYKKGLAETGNIEGRNYIFEYRFAGGNVGRLPALAIDLVQQRVAVIFASTLPATLAAQAATKEIPIVFVTGADPIENRLVESLSRPGGNVTGIVNLNILLAAKRLEVLHE